MKKKLISILSLCTLSTCMFFSCTTFHRTMREPYSKVDFTKNDFTLTEQVSAEAQSVKIIGIDWQRLFTKRTGAIEGSSLAISAANIPIVGSLIADETANFALYNLMEEHKGNDIVFYPQYEIKVVKPFLGIGFLTKVTNVKVTARLAKLKN